jgi:CO dehydrogenase maturation factor
MMKIAVVGKGGVGKTTISAFLARTFAERDYRVLAVDADPDANLASALPLDTNKAGDIIPLARQKEKIKAIVNQQGQLLPGLLVLNPDVTDLAAELTVSWGNGNQLVVMGWHKGGGQGCYCEENIVLRQLLSKVMTVSQQVVLIDSEAGLEHLSRGTVSPADAVIVVIEPGLRSVETAFASQKLCRDLGIAHVYVVLNGYETEAEVATAQKLLPDWPILAAFPRIQEVRQADLDGRVPALSSNVLAITSHIIDTLRTDIGG